MSNLVYDLTIAPMLHYLKNLDGLISKAEGHLAAHKDIEENTLVRARLYPNMRPFIYQIQVATDVAKGAAARLSGGTPPSYSDDESTLAEAHQRVRKTLDFISTIKPEALEGAEKRPVELKFRTESVKFTGVDYISKFAMPNFYFHVTTAYNILRHNGVVIGKADFTGA
jgi:hypothetical protein